MELQELREFAAFRLITISGNKAFDFGSLLSFQNGQSVALHFGTTPIQKLKQY